MISVQKSLKPGYSYIELMVAILVMIVLLSFVGPRVMSLLGSSKKASTKNTLKVVKGAIKEYLATTGSYPKELKDLVVKPEGSSNWDGSYLDEDSANPAVPKDAWDRDLVYKLNARGAKPPYELYSQGDPTKEEDRIDA